MPTPFRLEDTIPKQQVITSRIFPLFRIIFRILFFTDPSNFVVKKITIISSPEIHCSRVRFILIMVRALRFTWLRSPWLYFLTQLHSLAALPPLSFSKYKWSHECKFGIADGTRNASNEITWSKTVSSKSRNQAMIPFTSRFCNFPRGYFHISSPRDLASLNSSRTRQYNTHAGHRCLPLQILVLCYWFLQHTITT